MFCAPLTSWHLHLLVSLIFWFCLVQLSIIRFEALWFPLCSKQRWMPFLTLSWDTRWTFSRFIIHTCMEWVQIEFHFLLILQKMSPFLSMLNSTMQFSGGESTVPSLRLKTNSWKVVRYETWYYSMLTCKNFMITCVLLCNQFLKFCSRIFTSLGISMLYEGLGVLVDVFSMRKSLKNLILLIRVMDLISQALVSFI